VLVPNSQASTQCGASVRSTSQSGMTTVSRIQWVPEIPLITDAATKPRLRIAFGLVRTATAVVVPPPGSGGTGSGRGSGRRAIRTEFTASTTAVKTGSRRITGWLSVASATPLTSAPRVKPMFSAERRNAW
jgi:hypothetical protein